MSTETKQTVIEIVRFALITLIIVIPIRAYVAQPFIVSGVSMDPTYKNGEYLIIDEFTYHLRDPKRGEVIVFRYPEDPSKFFIKRVIGLPGETVSITGSGISIIDKEGKAITLDEPYVATDPVYSGKRIILKDGEFFVMGDNRNQSLDSRSWGPVPENLLKGRSLLRLFPVTRVGVLPGDYSDK